ncbi:MAG: hypothetical protein COA45_02525 [Zetaproteobacteria bacterium]|nr:MAG: hypothetical protein COA45_02525 [Zetaproteobacteria bacterium]
MRFTKVVLFTVISMTLGPMPLYAQTLTGLEIEELFSKAEELYTQAQPDMDAIIELTIYHTVEEAIVKQEIKSNKGLRIITEELTRDEIVADMKDKTGKMFDSSLRRTITNIDYSDDKMSALVEYTALFMATVNLSEEAKALPEYTGMEILPFKSLSVCSERFKLIDQVLKSLGTECKTELLYGKARAIR